MRAIWGDIIFGGPLEFEEPDCGDLRRRRAASYFAAAAQAAAEHAELAGDRGGAARRDRQDGRGAL